jgi:hypothetical protein
LLAAAVGRAAAAQGTPDTVRDSGYAAMQARGAQVMGVDQYTSTHVFEDLPDGGRIVLQRDHPDSAGTAMIRTHLATIAARFRQGDFSDPMMVHAEPVPGTEVMAARREQIRYTVESRPLGGAVRIRSTDPEAIAAIHAFLAYQRGAHHAGGHEMHGQ